MLKINGFKNFIKSQYSLLRNINQRQLRYSQQYRFFTQINQPQSKDNEQTQIPTTPLQTSKQDLDKQIQDQIKKDEEFFLPQKQDDKNNTQPAIDRVKKFSVQDPNDNKEDSTIINYDDTKIPLSVRERWQTIKVYEVFKEKAQWGEFYRVYGMVLMLLGGYFLVVPFYNVVCQTFGFTMRQHAKDYHFKDDQVNVFRKFRVSFMSHTESKLPWEFQASTSTVVVNAGETCLAFYKVYNRSDKPIAGIAIYQVYPEEVALYFNKIQCFCFENQLLYPKESVDLPVLFYLDPSINYDPVIQSRDIILTYHFFPSADQTIAKVLQAEIEKHEQEQQKLKEKKNQLIARGIKLDDVKGGGSGSGLGVIAPGHNPKDSAEMYVRKILANQKRINRNIEMYEQKEKDKEKEQPQISEQQNMIIEDKVSNINESTDSINALAESDSQNDQIETEQDKQQSQIENIVVA